MDLLELSARLRPWHAALLSLGRPQYRPEHDHPSEHTGLYIVWLGGQQLFPNGKVGASRLDRACEAVHLLTLLARVDLGMWKRMMLDLWGEDDDVREWIEYELPKSATQQQIGVGIEISDVSFDDIRGLRHLESTNKRLLGKPNPAFIKLRAELMDHVMDKSDRDDRDLSVAVRIDLELFQVNARRTTSMLKQALQCIESNRTQLATLGHSIAPHLRIVQVHLGLCVAVSVDKQGLQYLQQMTEHGIRVGHLPTLDIPMSNETIVSVIHAIRSLTALTRGDDGNPLSPGASMVTITDKFDPYLVPGLLSAVQESPVVTAVEIDLGDADEDDRERNWLAGFARPHDYREVWSWIACTLFSRLANHKVVHLEVNLDNIVAVEVDAVRQVLTAKNPLAMLASSSDSVDQDAEPQRICASRFCLADPTKRLLYWSVDSKGARTQQDAKKDVYLETAQPIEVMVFSAPATEEEEEQATGNNCWCVLLPGHGKAWVHRGDVIPTRMCPNPSSDRSKSPSFPTIGIIQMSDESADAAADLLALIGSDTSYVDVSDYTGEQPVDTWCHRVFSACPKLTKLRLQLAYVENLGVFVDAASHGQCRLQGLHLSVVPTGDSQHVGVFFAALSDPTHALTRHLQDLDLRLIVENEDSAAIIGPVLRVLQQNKRLFKLHLRLELRTSRLRALQPTFQAAFAKYAEKSIAIRLKPLDMRRKLAFLSVVDSKQPADFTDLAAARQLDSSVISNVFQFAAEARGRSFQFAFGPPEFLQFDE